MILALIASLFCQAVFMPLSTQIFDIDFEISSASSIGTRSIIADYNCKNEFEAKKSFTAQYHKIVSGACQPYVFVISELSQGCSDYFWEILFNP